MWKNVLINLAFYDSRHRKLNGKLSFKTMERFIGKLRSKNEKKPQEIFKKILTIPNQKHSGIF